MAPSPPDQEPPSRELPELVRLTDLIDVHQVAELLGLSGPTSVNAYRTIRTRDGTRLRYPDFPQPVLPVAPSPGKCNYWWRPEVIAWRDANPPRRTDSET